MQIMKSHEENNVVLPMRAQQAVQHIQLPSVSGTSNMAIGSASPSKYHSTANWALSRRNPLWCHNHM